MSLTATPSVAEGGTIIYTATLTNAAGTPVTVTLSNGAMITIAAGATSGTVTVAAPADDVYNDAGRVEATITTATGGNFENLVINPLPAVTDVTDTIDTTTVRLTATSSVAEGGTIVYTASVDRAGRPDADGRDPVQRPDDHHRGRRQHAARVNFAAPNDAFTGRQRR